MTEQQWFGSDFAPELLAHASHMGWLSPRQMRLIAVAAARNIVVTASVARAVITFRRKTLVGLMSSLRLDTTKYISDPVLLR
jgi:hypothetical protein